MFGVPRNLQFVLDTLFNGLKRLEYRGYDSAGIAVELVDAYPLTHSAPNGRGHSRTGSLGSEDILHEENGAHAGAVPLICKEVGKVDQLERHTFETVARDSIELARLFKNQVAIAHTRWATHGPPSVVNSHPHVSDPECEFTVVHNGIITNYNLLKEFLVSQALGAGRRGDRYAHCQAHAAHMRAA